MVNYEVKVVFQWASGRGCGVQGWGRGGDEVSEGDAARWPSRASGHSLHVVPCARLPVEGNAFYL